MSKSSHTCVFMGLYTSATWLSVCVVPAVVLCPPVMPPVKRKSFGGEDKASKKAASRPNVKQDEDQAKLAEKLDYVLQLGMWLLVIRSKICRSFVPNKHDFA